MSAFEQAVRTIQFLSADAVEKANSGHPGAPMGLAGIAVDLFSRYVRYVPDQPDWPNRDRFVLSCGHASMLLYSVLHLAGYDLPLDEIKRFRQLGSRTPGHPEVNHTPGVETSTGPLGQGLGNAVGLALAAKMAAARVNEPGSELIDYRVWSIASDGDLMEGVTSEAASLAGHLGLDNLVVVYDDNHVTIDGNTSLTFSEDVARRHEAYGWYVQKVDGHAPDEVRAALDRALREPARPSLIVARTHIAHGAPTKQDSSSSHGAPLGRAELAAAKERAGWPAEEFHVPEEARQAFKPWVERNRALHEDWRKHVAALSSERRARFEALLAREVPRDLLEQLSRAAGAEAEATRILSAKTEQLAARLVPSLIQGSADLAASCKTTIAGAGDVRRGEFGGRNLHYGIREHAMGAIMNGIALSGFFIPVGSTFLMFADYMRPAIRLACLMKQQVVYVFTHDSIFVGEDGPTHQPVEHLWALRIIPGLHVFRPADALECAAAWSHALGRRDGPTAIVLSRQKLPAVPRAAGFDPRQILDGAYVVADAADPDLVLLATGSELGVALEAQRALAARGKRVRVVSVPCVDLLVALPRERQEELLGRGVRRAAIEAGTTLPWGALLGERGIAIGVDRFGASAPAEELAAELGISANAVVARLLAELESAA